MTDLPDNERVAEVVGAGGYLGRATAVKLTADVYTASTTFIILESIRLDLGSGSQIHP